MQNLRASAPSFMTILFRSVLAAVAITVVSVLGFNVIHAKAAAGPVKSIPSPISSVLHWTASVYNYNPKGVDIANGKVTTGDIWVGVNAKGLPFLVHTAYSFDGGVFYQETLETPSTATEIMSSSVSGGSTCSQNFPYAQQQLSNRMPTFYSDTTLNQQQFTQSARTPSQALPSTSLLNGVSPVTVYPTPAVTKHWESVTGTAAVKNHTIVETDGHSRLIDEQVQYLDQGGNSLSLRWVANGPLLSYQAKDVPASVFHLQKQAQPCGNSATTHAVSGGQKTYGLFSPQALQGSGDLCNSGTYNGSQATLSYSDCEYILDASACEISYHYSNGLCWVIYTNPFTSSVNVYVLTAYDAGQDACGSDPYTSEMNASSYSEDTTSSPTNVGVGPYQGCDGRGHNYLATFEHDYAKNSAPDPLLVFDGNTVTNTYSPPCSGC